MKASRLLTYLTLTVSLISYTSLNASTSLNNINPLLKVGDCLDFSFDELTVAIIRDIKDGKYIVDVYTNKKLTDKSISIDVEKVDKNPNMARAKMICPDYTK